MGASDCADSDVDDALALSGLYSEIPSEDQKFYFHDITIEGRTITFSYSFCKQTRFDSIVVLDEPVSADYMPVLFAMGMCVCSWYWMGFYTSEVVICADVCVKCRVSLDMMPFWAELYHQTSLEFVHVNNIAYKEVSFVLEAPLEPAEISSPKRINFDRNAPNYSVLIPMGGLGVVNTFCPFAKDLCSKYCFCTCFLSTGGKDSLVVWHEHKWKGESRSNSPFSKKQKVRGATTLPSLTGRWSPTLPFMSLLKPPPAQPLLLYVADGLDEFHSSKRLQEMIRLTGDKVTLG